MASVNDLAQRWANKADPNDAAKWVYGDASMELLQVARTAWYPSQDPPSREDGDKRGNVLALYPSGGIVFRSVEQMGYRANTSSKVLWARIRDVVLMPPEDV